MSATLPRRAFLGAELPGDDVAFTADGIVVDGARPGGMADAAGLQAGDRLTALAGVALGTLADLREALRQAGTATATTLTFTRAGAGHAAVVAVVAHPAEADAALGTLAVDGATLRTLTLVPAAPRALVLVLQGIACESIELAAQDAPLAGLLAGWAAAGLASLRVERRGVGDSDGGPADAVDFTTEHADARAALDHARAVAAGLGVPLYLFGHSVGGIHAACLAKDHPDLAGVLVYGTPVTRWFDCLADSIQRQLALRGADDEALARALADLAAVAERGELNGRSAAYHAQLHALDLEATWAAVTARTLVLRGEHDWVVRAEDQARIADLAGGVTTVVDLPGLDHLFGWHPDRASSLRDYGVGPFDPAIVTATVGWIAAAIDEG